jgi:hypothetical protein
MASEIVLMSDCCMISDSWPSSPKLGVYARRKSPCGINLCLLK